MTYSEKGKRKTEALSLPFKEALRSYLRHKYPSKPEQEKLAKEVNRSYSTITGFIYNGIGGHELQYALLAVSLKLTSKSKVEKFIEEKQALFFSKAEKDMPPSIKLFFELYNNTDEDLLHYFMQTLSLNIKLAKEFNLEIKKQKKKR